MTSRDKRSWYNIWIWIQVRSATPLKDISIFLREIHWFLNSCINHIFWINFRIFYSIFLWSCCKYFAFVLLNWILNCWLNYYIWCFTNTKWQRHYLLLLLYSTMNDSSFLHRLYVISGLFYLRYNSLPKSPCKVWLRFRLRLELQKFCKMIWSSHIYMDGIHKTCCSTASTQIIQLECRNFDSIA